MYGDYYMSKVTLFIAAAAVMTAGGLLFNACKQKDKTIPSVFTPEPPNFLDSTVIKTKMTKDFIEKLTAYEGKKDTISSDVGNPSIGYGHKLTSEEIKTYSGRTVDDSEIYDILANDLNKVKAPVMGYSNLDFRKKQALIDYMYNKGPGMLTADLKNAIENNDFDTAASLINVNYWGKDPKNKKMGLSERRLWDIYMFTDGKPDTTALKTVKQLYKDGLDYGKKEGQNKNVMQAYKTKVQGWFKNCEL